LLPPPWALRKLDADLEKSSAGGRAEGGDGDRTRSFTVRGRRRRRLVEEEEGGLFLVVQPQTRAKEVYYREREAREDRGGSRRTNTPPAGHFADR